MRARALIVASLVCVPACGPGERVTMRPPATRRPAARAATIAPLRFAREQHLFIQPSALLVARSLLPTRGGGMVFVPERRWMYRFARDPDEVAALDADTHRILASLEFDSFPQLYVDGRDGALYDVSEERARALGAGARLGPGASHPVRWVSDEDGNRLYPRVEIAGREARLLTSFSPVASIVEDVSRGRVYACDPSRNSVLAFDARNDALVGAHRFPPPRIRGAYGPSSISLDPRTGQLFVAEGELGDGITVLDGATLHVVRRIAAPEPLTVLVDPRLNRVIVSSRSDTRVRVFDAASGRLLASQECDETPYVLAIDPRTSTCYVRVVDVIVACEQRYAAGPQAVRVERRATRASSAAGPAAAPH